MESYLSLSILQLFKKVTQSISLLKKIMNYLPLKQRFFYYNALIRPVINYPSVLWTNGDKESLGRVLKLQKRAPRVILNATLWHHQFPCLIGWNGCLFIKMPNYLNVSLPISNYKVTSLFITLLFVIPLDHITLDELHLILRMTDILIENWIEDALQWDNKMSSSSAKKRSIKNQNMSKNYWRQYTSMVCLFNMGEEKCRQ